MGKRARAVMVQGTGSNVGKSLLVAGLCRAALRRGLSVAPFKPQNMSNNAAVTPDGGEIGRAQALQAMAAGVPASIDMNPVLIKPESETGAQVVVQGRRAASIQASGYAPVRAGLMQAVGESFRRLGARHDLILVEGAGSPAEINLRANDIANMGFARAFDVPVVLAGDIDRGGVIAQIVGTQAVLDPADAAMIAGFVINRFRGDVGLFADGYRAISEHTGWRGFGILPHFPDAAKLPAEDAVEVVGSDGDGMVVACPIVSRIANFDDLDPLRIDPRLRVVMVPPGQPLPAESRLIVLPGSKSTRADLAFFRAQGWDVDLKAHVRRGGHVLGLCGGYQMLGQTIVDPDGLDGEPGSTEGLGLLAVQTSMQPEKRLSVSTAVHCGTGQPISGYEIHMGQTTGADTARPFAMMVSGSDGACSPDGRVCGTYMHGLFSSDGFRRDYLKSLGANAADFDYSAEIETVLNALADHVEAHLDVDALFALAR